MRPGALLALAAASFTGVTAFTPLTLPHHRLHKRYNEWKREVCPGGLSSCMPDYESIMPSQKYTITDVTNNGDWSACTDRPTCCSGSDTSCQNNPAQIGARVHSVTFADQTNIKVCVCPNAATTLDSLATLVSKVPREVRQYVESYKIANRDNVDAKGAFAYAAGGRLTFFGAGTTLSVVIHEIMHTFDAHHKITAPSVWGPPSYSDTCMPDYYAKTNRAEHMAQVGVVWVYISQSTKNWNSAVRGNGCFDNTLKLVSSYLPSLPAKGQFTGLKSPTPPPGSPAPSKVTLSGYTYDLSSLKSPIVFNGGLGTYYVSLNSYLPATISCSDGFAGACLHETWGADTILGYANDYSYALLDASAPASGVKLTYRGGDSCGGTIGNRTTVVTFRCGTASQTKFVQEAPTCTYQLEVVGPAG
ncbi:hypothetical protein HK104_006946 [Borealophlyctis nickersoniae]|nr:hypothetical protein HK104_006946 [Borealophlyctis nickersoniae]